MEAGARKKLPGSNRVPATETPPATTLKMANFPSEVAGIGGSNGDFLHFEIRAFCDDAPFDVINLGFKIIEIDRGHRFFDVEFAGHPIETGAIPVEDPIGGVAVLLNLDDDIPWPMAWRRPLGMKMLSPFSTGMT